MKKLKLKWQKKWLDDKSGFWYSSIIPIIYWEYIIEPSDNSDSFTAYILSSSHEENAFILGEIYKTKESAISACEKHLEKNCDKLLNWLKKRACK